ncbi:TPA: hypothetical protein UMF52_003254 [Stenotrophomonas maltophilia]|nr:hypothetical protein [Stenotrophomonas maltophilia]
MDRVERLHAAISEGAQVQDLVNQAATDLYEAFTSARREAWKAMAPQQAQDIPLTQVKLWAARTSETLWEQEYARLVLHAATGSVFHRWGVEAWRSLREVLISYDEVLDAAENSEQAINGPRGDYIKIIAGDGDEREARINSARKSLMAELAKRPNR